MKKTMIIVTGILALAAAQPALASGDGHNMKDHMHDSMKNPCAMADHQNMQGNMKNPCAMKDHQHMKGEMKGHKQGDMGQNDTFMKKMPGKLLAKKEIDGYTVNFYAMKAEPGKEMGGSHDFMIKVEKDGVAVTGLTANSKVVHPNGKSESKMMMKMNDWYMAGYDLGHEGQHQLMALFKTVDGAKHFGGVFYPEDK